MGESASPAFKLHQLKIGRCELRHDPILMDPAIWGSLPPDILMHVLAYMPFDAQMRAKVLSKWHKQTIELPRFRLESIAVGMPLPTDIFAFEVIGASDDPHGTARMYYPNFKYHPFVQDGRGDRLGARPSRIVLSPLEVEESLECMPTRCEDLALKRLPLLCTGKVDNMSLSFLPRPMQTHLTSGFRKKMVHIFGNGLICIKNSGSAGGMAMTNLLNRTWRLLPKLKLPNKQTKEEWDEVEIITCHVDEGASNFEVIHFLQWCSETRDTHTWYAGIYASVTDSWRVVQGQPYTSPTRSIRNASDVLLESYPTGGNFVTAFGENRMYTQFNIYDQTQVHVRQARLLVHSLDDGVLLEDMLPKWPREPTVDGLLKTGLKRESFTNENIPKFQEWKGLWYYKGNLYGAVTYSVGGDILLGITMLHPDEMRWGKAKLLPFPPWIYGQGWRGLLYGWDGNLGLAGQYIWAARYFMRQEKPAPPGHSFSPCPRAPRRRTNDRREDWHTLSLFDIHAGCWIEVLTDVRDQKSCKLSVFEPKACVNIHL